MARFKLDDNFKRKLEKQCQEKARELAIEARERLYEKYISLIDWYYADYSPKLNKYGEPYYTRTFNLYKSVHKYYLNSHNSTFYGGIDINSSGMLSWFNIFSEVWFIYGLIKIAILRKFSTK